MKFLLGLFKNPHAVMFSVFHWILVLYLVFEKRTRKQSPFADVNAGYFNSFFRLCITDWQDYLSFSILIIDLPAILLAKLIWSPFQLYGEPTFGLSGDDGGLSNIVSYLGKTPLDAIGKEDIISNGLLLISFLTITLQWIILGKIVSDMIISMKSRMTVLDLNDE